MFLTEHWTTLEILGQSTKLGKGGREGLGRHGSATEMLGQQA